MTKFRFHRRMLDESLDTQVEVKNKQELLDLIKIGWLFPKEEIEEFKIEYYCYDDRINWNTYMVLINGYPAGFTDGPLDD